MIGGGVDFAFAARADDVTRTILVVAKKRTAAMDARFLVRLGRLLLVAHRGGRMLD
jgi:hypothetical protein